jgi:hypothetical protein
MFVVTNTSGSLAGDGDVLVVSSFDISLACVEAGSVLAADATPVAACKVQRGDAITSKPINESSRAMK